MTIDELNFTWDNLAAGHRSRNGSSTGKPPNFDDYIDFLEQFDRRGATDTVDRHIDKQFVLPAKPGDD